MPRQKVDKETIIRNSLQVFKNLGYHKASMADIALSCGLLKGSIYHYFSGKEDLMQEVILFLHSYYDHEVFSIAYSKELNGREKLEKLAGLSQEIFIEQQGGCLMANIGLETVNVVPEFSEKIKNFFDDWIKCLAHIFKEKMSPGDARDMAIQAVAEIEGSVMLMQLYQDEQILHRAHERIMERFVSTSQKSLHNVKRKE